MAATFDVAAMLEVRKLKIPLFPDCALETKRLDTCLLFVCLQWGEGMGREFYGKGANVQLGPGLCLARVPRNGRNFEYLSGEDPFLGYTLVQPVISGIRSQRVVLSEAAATLDSQTSVFPRRLLPTQSTTSSTTKKPIDRPSTKKQTNALASRCIIPHSQALPKLTLDP